MWLEVFYRLEREQHVLDEETKLKSIDAIVAGVRGPMEDMEIIKLRSLPFANVFERDEYVYSLPSMRDVKRPDRASMIATVRVVKNDESVKKE